MQRILYLQQGAGNQAVSTLLSPPGRSVPPAVVQRQGKPAKRTDQKANIAKLTTFKTNADARFTLTSDLSSKALAVGDATKTKLGAVGRVYGEAYKNFRKVLDDAQQQAENQQFWTNTVVGIVCGVGASLLAAWALPSTAAGAFVLTASEALGAAASGLGQAVGGAAVATGVSKMLDVEGKKIDSSGLDPTLQELDMWKKAADIYRSGLVFSEAGKTFHSLTVALADLIADVRATDGKLTDQQIEEKVAVLTTKDAEMSKAEADLRAKIGELDKIKAGVDQIDPARKSALDMEKDLWQLWMGSLKLNSNILDINAIEDHIGPKGLGLVDFGSYTSDADENEAIERARDTAAQLNAEAHVTDVPEDKARQLRVVTR